MPRPKCCPHVTAWFILLEPSDPSAFSGLILIITLDFITVTAISTIIIIINIVIIHTLSHI